MKECADAAGTLADNCLAVRKALSEKLMMKNNRQEAYNL